MENLSEILSLYDPANLPERIRKELELKRWRDIMAQQKYEQDDLPGYLDAEAQAKQSDIPVIETQKHLAKWGLRFEKYASLSKNPIYKRAMFEQRRKCFDMINLKERS